MNLLFTDEAWEEYIYWQEANKTILEINGGIAHPI